MSRTVVSSGDFSAVAYLEYTGLSDGAMYELVITQLDLVNSLLLYSGVVSGSPVGTYNVGGNYYTTTTASTTALSSATANGIILNTNQTVVGTLEQTALLRFVLSGDKLIGRSRFGFRNNTGTFLYHNFICGGHTGLAGVDGIRVFPNSGTISGKATLYKLG